MRIVLPYLTVRDDLLEVVGEELAAHINSPY